VAQVVGENLRALRIQTGDSQPEASRRLIARAGLHWTRANIAYIESGARTESLGLDVVHAIAAAYDVRPSVLFNGDGLVRYPGGFTVTREDLRAALDAGEVPRMQEPERDAEPSLGWATEADKALADRMEIPLETVIKAAQRLWDGRSLTEERDRRVADTSQPGFRRSLQARRGRVTRELVHELMPQLPDSRRWDGP
jgi:transcriptional regulator with XRE-family HTH domain